jgi:hypothetical protein
MNKKIFFGILFISIFCFGIASPILAASYTYPLEGAEGVAGESEVKIYDEDAWKDCVGDEYKNPTKLWSGDSDEVGAKSKSVIKEYDDDKLNIWDVMELLGMDVEDMGIDSDAQDLLETALGLEGEWKVWMVTRDAWDFTADAYDEDPDDEDDEFPIFKDPKDGEEIMEEIGLVITYIYTQMYMLEGLDAATAAGYGAAAASLVNGDYIAFMMLVDKGLPMAKDVEDYTEALLKALDCDKVKYKDGVVTIPADKVDLLNAEDDYTIECTISSDYGTVSKVEFLDGDDEVFYSKEGLAPFVPGYELPILLGITAVFTIGIIYAIRKRT